MLARRSRTPRTARSSTSSARARCTSSSPRTSTACTTRRASRPSIVVEIHGNVREAKCMTCGWRGPMAETLDRVRAGEDDPACEHCGGILKSATISFGENLVAEDLERAQLEAARGDVFLALGTSLGVYPGRRAARDRAARRRPARDHQRRGDAVRRRSPTRCSATSSATCCPRWPRWSERRSLGDPSRWEYPTLEVGFTAVWRVTETS